jgi:hypothetical protein
MTPEFADPSALDGQMGCVWRLTGNTWRTVCTAQCAPSVCQRTLIAVERTRRAPRSLVENCRRDHGLGGARASNRLPWQILAGPEPISAPTGLQPVRNRGRWGTRRRCATGAAPRQPRSHTPAWCEQALVEACVRRQCQPILALEKLAAVEGSGRTEGAHLFCERRSGLRFR